MNKMILVVLISIILGVSAYADLGPKPSMDFKISYKTSKPLSIIEATQMQCKDKGCSDPKPLSLYGPQHFECDGIKPSSFPMPLSKKDTCFSLSYGYDPYQKLVLRFSDNVVRESNIFPANQFTAHYSLTVTDSALIVELISSEPPPKVGRQ
jgi:hypothetical protein